MKCEGNVLILYVKIRDENNSGKLQLHIKVPPITRSHLANIHRYKYKSDFVLT